MSTLELLLTFVPSLTYPLICLTYYFVLKQKRNEIFHLIKGETLKRYLNAYGLYGEKNGAREYNEKYLFRKYYDWKGYFLPVILNMLSAIILSLTFFAQKELIKITDSTLSNLIMSIPLTVVTGFAGAYVWSHYDLLRRFFVIDLSPHPLYNMWIRFMVSGILAYLISPAFTDSVALLIAFGVGTFPLHTLNNFLRKGVLEKLKLEDELKNSEKPNLYLLQGMTKNIIERFEEENIYSAQHLALADPIRLLMKTNIEWTTLLDFIDQAILYSYVGNKITEIRECGIRCAMELSQLQKKLDSNNTDDIKSAENLTDVIAKKLQWEKESVTNMINILDGDDQLTFISDLWGEAFPPKQPEIPTEGQRSSKESIIPQESKEKR